MVKRKPEPKPEPSRDTSGYPEGQLHPDASKPRLPGKGGPREPQNLPERKPGKG